MRWSLLLAAVGPGLLLGLACAPASRKVLTSGTSGSLATGTIISGPETMSSGPTPEVAPASAVETLLLPLDTDVSAAVGITFRYYLAPRDGDHARYALRFSKGGESEMFLFDVADDHDFYGEGVAFRSLFQMRGREVGARLRLAVHAAHSGDPISAFEVEEHRRRLTPEGTADWTSHERNGGHHLVYFDKKKRVLLHAVIGAMTGEALYLGKPEM